VLDRTSPHSSAALGPTARPGVLALSWRGHDAAPSSGLAEVSWRLRRTDTGAVIASGTSGSSGTALRSVPRGATYQLEVDARDALNHTSGTAVSPLVAAR
jgi:hypothetical protein